MSNIKIYLDTIFTGLHKDADLISIGMIVNDRSIKLKKSLYIEFNDYDPNKITNWVDKNMISNLVFLHHHDPHTLEATKHSILIKCNKQNAQIHIYEWMKNIYECIKHSENKIQFVGDICYYDVKLLTDLLKTGTQIYLSDFISSEYIDINTKIEELYNISSSLAFKRSREDIIQEFETLFEMHSIPPTFNSTDQELLIPKNVIDKKHNALNNAFAVSKFDAYITDAENLFIFDD